MQATSNGAALLRLGYGPEDARRALGLTGGRLDSPADVVRAIDTVGYQHEWRSGYRVQSVRSSLHAAKITCIDAAILAYGLLEAVPAVDRRLLAIHRRDPARDEECGHVVTIYRGPDGQLGAISKSSFPGLGHRAPVFADEHTLATSFAEAYVAMGFTPLYFGTTTLEEVAPDVDWRFDPQPLNVLSERLQGAYAFGFEVAR